MIATLVELQRLKRLERTGWMLRGLPTGSESVAAHSFGVALAAMLLADEICARGERIEVETVLRLALVHDWAEVRVGDLPKTASEYFGAQARRDAEIHAFSDIVSHLTEGVATRYRELHKLYEARATLEARIVKAADILDLLVQTLAFERAGARGLDEFWENALQLDFGLTGIAHDVVTEAFRQIVAARAKLS